MVEIIYTEKFEKEIKKLDNFIKGKVAKQIEKLGQEALVIKADVSKEDEVKNLVGQTIKHFGKVDILVNNAGMYPHTPIEEIKVEDWDRLFAINVRSAFLCTKHAIPHMKKRKEGCIINISSVAGHKGSSYSGAHYSSTKSALLGFTKSLARELSEFNIRANSVSPGPIDTDLLGQDGKRFGEKTLMKRLGKPSEIARVMVFLASGDSSYITGTDILVDGGWMIK